MWAMRGGCPFHLLDAMGSEVHGHLADEEYDTDSYNFGGLRTRSERETAF